MEPSPIAIFDSGVGGLTVVKEVVEAMPDEDLIYFGDTARCPYGPRSLEQVKGFAFEILDHLSSLRAKLVIVACNTATAAALIEAQNHYSIPIVGVIEPGAHAAVQSTMNRKIGVIATEATVASGIYERYIKYLDAGAEVTSVACPGFVEFVESGDTENDDLMALAAGYFEPLLSNGVDTLILGCTHYPLMVDSIGSSMGPGVRLISSARETAVEVRSILDRRGQLSIVKKGADYRFMSTGDTSKFMELGSMFLGQDIAQVEHVKL